MTPEFIISQVLVSISYAFSIGTYLVKSHKMMLVTNLISIFFLALSYVFLSAWSGFAANCVCIVRTIILIVQLTFFSEKTSRKCDIAILVILFALCIVVGIITYSHPLSILPIIATLFYTYSIWQKNNFVYKVLGVPVSVLWLLYNIFVGSIFGAIFEGILLVVITASLIIHIVKIIKLKKSEKEKNC